MDSASSSNRAASRLQSPNAPSPLHDLRGQDAAAKQAANLSFSTELASNSKHVLSAPAITPAPAFRAALIASGFSSSSGTGNLTSQKPQRNLKAVRGAATLDDSAGSHNAGPLIAARLAGGKGLPGTDPRLGVFAHTGTPGDTGTGNFDADQRNLRKEAVSRHSTGDGAHLAANIAVSRRVGSVPPPSSAVERKSPDEVVRHASNKAKVRKDPLPSKKSNIHTLTDTPLASVAAARKIFELRVEKTTTSHANIEILSPKPVRATSPLLESTPALPLFPQTRQNAVVVSQRSLVEPNLRVSSKGGFGEESSASSSGNIGVSAKSADVYSGPKGSPEARISDQKRAETGISPLGPQQALKADNTGLSNSSLDTFVSASDNLTDLELSLYEVPSRAESTISISRSPGVPGQSSSAALKAFGDAASVTSERWLQPTHTGDSMRYAIQASSLASSRGPSPSKGLAMPSTPPPLRNTEGGTMRTTLRKDHERHKSSSPKPKPKKNADVVEPRQLRRYESLWASNRGLYSEDPENVVSVVVRDIFGRSRLPTELLEGIWNLVDTTGAGYLSRESFLVGLFLVDSCLDGKKLPARISDELWASVSRAGVFPRSLLNKKKQGKRKKSKA